VGRLQLGSWTSDEEFSSIDLSNSLFPALIGLIRNVFSTIGRMALIPCIFCKIEILFSKTAQKWHVKSQNGSSDTNKTGSNWHVSPVPSAIIEV
jgi:hypothetical protein